MGSAARPNHRKNKGLIALLTAYYLSPPAFASLPSEQETITPGAPVTDAQIYDGPDLTPLNVRIEAEYIHAQQHYKTLSGLWIESTKTILRLCKLHKTVMELDGLKSSLPELTKAFDTIESIMSPHFSLKDKLKERLQDDRRKPTLLGLQTLARETFAKTEDLKDRLDARPQGLNLDWDIQTYCQHLQKILFHTQYLLDVRNRKQAQFDLEAKRLLLQKQSMDKALTNWLVRQQTDMYPLKLATRMMAYQEPLRIKSQQIEEYYLAIIDRLQQQIALVEIYEDKRSWFAFHPNALLLIRHALRHPTAQLLFINKLKSIFPNDNCRIRLPHPACYKSFPKKSALPPLSNTIIQDDNIEKRIFPTHDMMVLWNQYLQGSDTSSAESIVNKEIICCLHRLTSDPRLEVKVPATDLRDKLIDELVASRQVHATTRRRALREILQPVKHIIGPRSFEVDNYLLGLKLGHKLNEHEIKACLSNMMNPLKRAELLGLKEVRDDEILPLSLSISVGEKVNTVTPRMSSLVNARLRYLTLLAGVDPNNKNASSIRPDPRKAVRELLVWSRIYEKHLSSPWPYWKDEANKILSALKKIYMELMQRAYLSQRVNNLKDLKEYISELTQTGQAYPLSDTMRDYMLDLIDLRQRRLAKFLPWFASHVMFDQNLILDSIISRKSIYTLSESTRAVPRHLRAALVLYLTSNEFFSIEGTIYKAAHAEQNN